MMKNQKIIYTMLIEFLVIGIGAPFFCMDLFPTSYIPPNEFLNKLFLFIVYCLGYGLSIKVIRGYYDTFIQICYCKSTNIQIRAYVFYPFFKEKNKRIKILKFPDYFNSNVDISIQEYIDNGMSYNQIYKEKISKVQNSVFFANVLLILICIICILRIPLYWITPIIATSLSRIYFLSNNETIIGEKGFDLHGDNMILNFRSGINYLSTTDGAKSLLYSTLSINSCPKTNLKNYFEYQFLTEALLDSICNHKDFVHKSKWKEITNMISNQNVDVVFAYLPILRLYAIKVFIENDIEEYENMLVLYRNSIAALICSADSENDYAIAIAQNQLDELIQKKEIHLLAYEQDNVYRYYSTFQEKRTIVEKLYKSKALNMFNDRKDI